MQFVQAIRVVPQPTKTVQRKEQVSLPLTICVTPCCMCITDICHSIDTQEDKKLVHKSLREVGDWSNLCLYLDVNSETRNALQYDNKKVQQKRTECVDAYLKDTVPLCFEKVVEVLCELHQSIDAKELAEKKDVDFLTVCEHA